MEPDFERSQGRLWAGVVFWFVAVEAVGFQMRGALLPSLERTFSVSTGLLGLVATAGTVGFVLAVLLTGLYMGRIDPRRAMLGSALVVTASILLMGFAPTFSAYLALLLLRGIATGPFRALDRAILSHLYPGSRGRVFNLYALAWAVGAAAGPLVVAGALFFGGWRIAYFALAVAFLPVVVALTRLDLPTGRIAERPLTRDRLAEVLRRPAIFGMSAATVVGGGVEGSLFTWLPYFATTRFDPTTSSLLLTTYLLAYLPARLGYSVIVDRFRSPIDLVVALAMGALPVLYLVVFVLEGYALFLSVFALGFLVSGLFPTLSAFGVDRASEYSGPVNALVTSTQYVGIATVPPILGVVIARYGVTDAFGLLLGLLFVLVLVTGAIQFTITPTATSDSLPGGSD